MSRYRPSYEDFAGAWTRPASCVPVYRQLTGDGLTPVSAFRRIERTGPLVPVRERHRRREGRPVQLPGHRAVPHGSRPGAGGPHRRARPRGRAARRFTSDDPLRRSRAARSSIPGRRTCRACLGSPAGRSATRLTTPSATPRTCPTPPPTIAACPTSRSPSTTGWSCSTTSARRSWSSRTPTSGRRRDPAAAYRAGLRSGRRAGRPPGRARPRPGRPRHRHRRARSRSSPESNFTREPVRGGRPPLPGIHQGRRHLPGRPEPAIPGRDHAPSRSTSTACCGSSIPARSCSICRSATSR